MMVPGGCAGLVTGHMSEKKDKLSLTIPVMMSSDYGHGDEGLQGEAIFLQQ